MVPKIAENVEVAKHKGVVMGKKQTSRTEPFWVLGIFGSHFVPEFEPYLSFGKVMGHIIFIWGAIY